MSITAFRKLLAIAGVFTLSALVGALVTNYTFHRLRVWDAEGVFCTRFMPDGSLERRYGTDCEPN